MRPTSIKQCTGRDRKGSFQYLVCENTEIVVEHRDTFGIAPHEEQNVTKTLSRNEKIVNCAQPGDYFRFMKNVGGGGGHKLFVEEFKAILEINTKSSTESYHGLASYIE